MRTKYILPMALVLIFGGAIHAEFESETLGTTLGARTEKFLRGSTGEARGQMAQFSDEDLQKITNAFKKDHSATEQRIFWLSEELYRRNAERVAAERIRYLYYAVLAALLILTGFVFLTYRQGRRISNESAPASPIQPASANQTATRKKNPKAKGRSKR